MSIDELLIFITFPLTGNYTCMEWGNCTLNGQIFNVALYPYEWALGSFALVAIWGIILGVIWQKSHNTALVGVVGVVLNSLVVGFYAPARQIGWYLLAISAGITLYWLFIVRPHGGTAQ